MNRAIRWFSTQRSALVWVWMLWLVPRALLAACTVIPTSDAGWYYSRAVALAAGQGYLANNGSPTAFWPAGLSLVLAGLFRVTGPSLLAVSLFNLVCAGVSALCLYALTRRISGSELAARVALLLLALYPNNAAYVPLVMTEVFYTMLLLAGCWLIVGYRHLAALVAAGLVFGLAMLVKAQSLVVVPLLFAIALLRAPGWARRLPGVAGRMMLVVVVALLVVSPWSLRNHRVLHQWVVVSTNGGITLLTGNNDSAQGDYTPNDRVVDALGRRKDLTEVGYDAEARRLAVVWIKAHPARFVELMPMKLFRLWGPDGEAQWHFERGWAPWPVYRRAGLALRVVNQLWYLGLLLGLALFAPFEIRRRRRGGMRLVDWWLLPYGLVAYSCAIAVVFSGQSRFHYPVMPFACMAWGWLVAHWVQRGGDTGTEGHAA